ncbi:MAG: hypothetical protein KJ970_20795 [Candidatus Eisenbacteria bacterium]|uniref:Glycine zipper family protein n=1 Tax=Eiseniibacteriota bacterium TaxID=2212470 RepID=A0A948RYI3_UNCEI|nr:hypothetical protein [Candidatus Eisenbacteria bacterium]MBU1947186.1 hypothetical protein [Candidatus Eisenbacteria bacterium]MBU2693365.1 hypothetical protein [Candidatus Eisenbacteria bacterium]
MKRLPVAAAFLVWLILTAAAGAETKKPPDDDIEIRLEYPIVIRAARPQAGNPGSDYLRNYLLNHPVAPRDDDTSEWRAVSHAAGMGGLEPYELSRSELAWQGMGMGASLGLCAGAIGSSFGWWGDDKALMMMGAMSALGAIWKTSKADQPGVHIQFRLKDDPPEYREILQKGEER